MQDNMVCVSGFNKFKSNNLVMHHKILFDERLNSISMPLGESSFFSSMLSILVILSSFEGSTHLLTNLNNQRGKQQAKAMIVTSPINLQFMYAKSNIVLKTKIEIMYITNVVKHANTITSFIDFVSINTLITSTRIREVNDIVTMFVNGS